MVNRSSVLAHDVTMDKGHHWGEIRKVYLSQALDLAEESLDWKDLKTMIMVERTRILKDRVEQHTQFYISSLSQADPAVFAQYIRQHWAIENNLHWQSDVCFKEDDARVKNHNALINLHQIRKWALYLLQKDPTKISIKRKRKKASRNSLYLKAILT